MIRHPAEQVAPLNHVSRFASVPGPSVGPSVRLCPFSWFMCRGFATVVRFRPYWSGFTPHSTTPTQPSAPSRPSGYVYAYLLATPPPPFASRILIIFIRSGKRGWGKALRTVETRRDHAFTSWRFPNSRFHRAYLSRSCVLTTEILLFYWNIFFLPFSRRCFRIYMKVSLSEPRYFFSLSPSLSLDNWEA